MKKKCIQVLLGFIVSFIILGYAVAEVAPPDSGSQQDQKLTTKFDIRKQMIERGEMQIQAQPRAGLKAAKIPEASLQAASRLALLPGMEFVKSFHIDWGPRNLPQSLLNFERPLTNPDIRSSLAISKSFLKENQALFRLSPTEVDSTVIEKDYATKHNGARHVVLLQALDGVPVFQGRLNFNYDKQGRLVLMQVGDVVPGLSVVTDPTLDEAQAVKAAVQALGKPLPVEPVVIKPRGNKGESAVMKNPFGGEVNVRLMIFPLADSGRLAWWMQLDLHNGTEWYEMLVDALTGELLYRNNLYSHQAHGRVFTDNPSRGARQYLEFPANWLSSDQTEGNNVDAHHSTTGNHAASPNAAPNQDFDFTWGDGLTNQDPRNFDDAAITNLFYLVNVYHDYTYALGFDEPAGNFQVDNFGLGGAGNDRVHANAQDPVVGPPFGATFSTPVDGTSPTLTMGFAERGTAATTDDLDRDVNGDTVFHESTHGLSNRLVGDSTTTSCLSDHQGSSMGEGWGDFMAINHFDDPVYGEYQSQNFVSGIRRAAYNNQPRTFADLGDTGFEVHDDGEIWGATLWDLRQSLIAAHGHDVGQQMAAQLAVDGMKLSTCNPGFIDERNSILMADQQNNNGANKCLIWQVFSDRGMGNAAVGDSTFTHNADFNTSPACVTPRNPIDIVLVLDHSGSMASPAPGGTQNKIDLLKDAVELFVRSWQPYAVAGDNVGVVYFESNVTKYHDPLLVSFVGNEDNIITSVRSYNPANFTAMGGGLQTAFNGLLASPNAKKHVILFTDGMQNCSPMVRELPPDGTPPEPNHEIKAEPVTGDVYCDSGIAGAPGVSLESYLTGHNIKLHTIGTGVSGVSWQNLLTSIANETGGENHFTSTPDLELFRFYEEDLVTALAGNTLELVKYKTGGMKKGQKEIVENFTINTSSKRASFILSWRNISGQNALNVKLVSPSGTHVYPSEWRSSKYYQIATFDFPLYQRELKVPIGDRPPAAVVDGHSVWIDHRGVWKMIIEAENVDAPSVSYDASLLVDEAKLEYEFNATKGIQGTGDRILLTAKVTEDGNPLHRLTKAEVTLKRPGLGIGTFLSNNAVSKTDLAKDLGVHQDNFPSLVEKKTYLLLQNPDKRSKLNPVQELVLLFDDGRAEHGDAKAGDGTYSAVVKNTTLPGTYSAAFHVEGKTFRSGEFSRTKLVTTQVQITKPSVSNTKLNVERIVEKGIVVIMVTPFDQFKNNLGPGYSRVVEITASNGQFTGPVIDNLDGTYSRFLQLTDPSADPNIQIKVLGSDIYTGPLSGITSVVVSGWCYLLFVLFAVALIAAFVLLVIALSRGASWAWNALKVTVVALIILGILIILYCPL